MKTYASIHIGSYGISFKVFEISKENGIKRIDSKRRRIDLSHDVFVNSRINKESFFAMTDIIKELKETMDMYRVDDYDAYLGASLLGASNLKTFIDQVRLTCDLDIKVLENSEQRFTTYKAICALKDFSDIISERTVLVDVGGSSIQLTLFDGGRLLMTQHVVFGATNVREDVIRLRRESDYREQLLGMLYKEIENFYDMYLERIPPRRLVIVNNPLNLLKKTDERMISDREYLKIIKKALSNSTHRISPNDTSDEATDVSIAFLLLYRSVIEKLPVDEIYVPHISLHEGMVHDYAYSHKLLKQPRDFEGDVLSAAETIAKRFNSRMSHVKNLERTATRLFDSFKKRHGLSKRNRLYLRVAAILHDCGKYISLSNEAGCTYTIITSSEIFGLTERERQIIARVCIFYHDGIPEYDELFGKLSENDYYIAKKLCAILSVAGALDLSHKKQIKDIKFRIEREQTFVITMDTRESLSLERSLFTDKADVFEDAFALRPVLRTKRLS